VSQNEAMIVDRPILFVLSFRQRDELAGLAARGGWQVVAARRGEAVDRRFRASGAAIAVVDARGAMEDGLSALRVLTGAPHRPAVTIACLSRGDADRLDAVREAGATHFLVSPISEAVFVQTLRFAEAMARNASEGARRGPGMLGWRHDPARGTVQLTPALAALVEARDSVSPRTLLRLLSRGDRRRMLAAVRRLTRGAASTALAHEQGTLGRLVQHLQRDPQTGRVHALIEPLGDPPDVGAVLRDTMPTVRDERGARQWIDHALGAGATLGLAQVTLARFDMVNAAYGRQAGDRLLRAVTRRIEEAVAPVLGRRAMIARIDGARFAIATREGGEAMARVTAAVETALARPFVIDGDLVPVGCQIAVVESGDGEDAAWLLRRLGSEREGEGDARIARLAAELRHAIEDGQIDTVFQPQVAIASGRIMGVEALARWRHPALGELGAETLFASADHAGLGSVLSDHVQKRALDAAAAWKAPLDALRLSINVTAEDVGRPGFADRLLGMIDAAGFPRSRLTVEITESGLIAELGEAAGLLAELRRAGCRVAIDDFGTGYSSLAYLKALPLDYLKIDRQLSQDIAGSARDRVVVRGVIDMARSLGLSVIAEGVETPEQLDLLAKEGCQYFQGYLCAPPMDAGALAELLAG
jgi:EAL domain-containing protein (putative c-di-GMP-specific phosphodiesterase class I)/GGDEF domain-containing protein/DNA-binding response OmpR family regulator